MSVANLSLEKTPRCDAVLCGFGRRTESCAERILHIPWRQLRRWRTAGPLHFEPQVSGWHCVGVHDSESRVARIGLEQNRRDRPVEFRSYQRQDRERTQELL
ncbi:MAG: hypothetical protein VYD86_11760, partial [Verrucomicrobiota bacterium]|nr:hypothetical protein [Verrucomicrobiota bacterium]